MLSFKVNWHETLAMITEAKISSNKVHYKKREFTLEGGWLILELGKLMVLAKPQFSEFKKRWYIDQFLGCKIEADGFTTSMLDLIG